MFREYMLKDIARMIGARARTSDRELVRGISINSKSTCPGDLFFALKGERTDGHHFIAEAIAHGACAAVVEHSVNPARELCVNDTLTALGDLGSCYRNSFRQKTIAVTGTNGKTTVKNLIAALLSTQYLVHYTRKNYNSLIGLPLTLFDLTGTEDYLIVEMGTSNPGEIERLCKIARPDIGVITTVGAGHLKGLNSIEGVRREKVSLINALPADGYAFVGESIGAIRSIRSRNISMNLAGDIRLREDGSYFTYQREEFSTPLLGASNVYNCLIGLCVSDHLGISRQNQHAALRTIRVEPGRMEPIRCASLLIINDTYNANPVSMKAAGDFIAALPKKAICVLGDMLELGGKVEELHQEVGHYMHTRCEMLLSFGVHARHYGGKHFTDRTTLVKYLIRQLRGDEVILIKASRALHFEDIVSEILRES